MNSRLHNLLHNCKNLIMYFPRMIKGKNALKAKEKILSIKRNMTRDKVKVGFIVQMPEIWDKEAPVFEALLRDDRFDACLIVVPHYDYSKDKLCSYGDELEYFRNKYPDLLLITLKDLKDNVIDDSYDYVFYQRCWELYLPVQLRCRNVIKHAMTCYTPYGFHCGPESHSYYCIDFFRYLSKFYCCSKDQAEEVKQIGYIDSSYLGYPGFTALDYSKKRSGNTNILWTPRWINDQYGGSTFYKYKDKILDLLDISDSISLKLRPHPLTFENAVKEKRMTEEEVKEYIEKIRSAGASFDINKIVGETFSDTDILITDFSSVVVFYYVSGRPIIYCSDTNIPMTGLFRQLIDSVYIAKSWEDVYRITKDLVNGIDPLYEKRQEVIRKMDVSKDSVSKIVEDLYKTLN